MHNPSVNKNISEYEFLPSSCENIEVSGEFPGVWRVLLERVKPVELRA